ncbi:MAG: lysophospholipid acyltransferase family protein [Acidimicrobiia bacterium]|nr:lysophospholipid acyltransferase family protein [Acidimicrobiia bacterium]
MTGTATRGTDGDEHRLGGEMTRTSRVLYGIVRAAIVYVGRVYFRLRVDGREHVPTSGPFIVSPVHRSNLDTPIIGAITKRRMRYMGKESLWENAFGAWSLTVLGGFPVQRGQADRAALQACIEVLERGEPLVVFPEGTRQQGPLVQKLFDGPAYVACRTGAPIVPVGLGGTERAMPVGAKFVRPTRVAIVIGEPIHPPAPIEQGRVPRRAVRELTEHLRRPCSSPLRRGPDPSERVIDRLRVPGRARGRHAVGGRGCGAEPPHEAPQQGLPARTQSVAIGRHLPNSVGRLRLPTETLHIIRGFEVRSRTRGSKCSRGSTS